MAEGVSALHVLRQMFANIEPSESEEKPEVVSEHEDGIECAQRVAEDEGDEEEEEEQQEEQEEEELRRGRQQRNEHAQHVSEDEQGDGGEHGGQEYDAVDDDARQIDRDTFVSKNGQIEWHSVARRRDSPRRGSPRNSPEGPPRGPTAYAVSHARDILSTFLLFVTPRIERLVLDVTNREGYLKRGDEWRAMDATDLRAYIGLLILAGVYKSRGKAAASLWDAQSGRAIFRATMQLKLFYTYSTSIRFDDRATRATRPTSWPR